MSEGIIIRHTTEYNTNHVYVCLTTQVEVLKPPCQRMVQSEGRGRQRRRDSGRLNAQHQPNMAERLLGAPGGMASLSLAGIPPAGMPSSCRSRSGWRQRQLLHSIMPMLLSLSRCCRRISLARA
ncbi:hypothetical protein GALMADRAFT_407759 [Galerina marginata CBS 339.88]|uniref:Uncharacterized protein n=1 Tax=Galerina marginata (strain CBS 339.88) TaxID=685588 RepID=A0A067T358_GALM3|nr:hypothetical protein GALMADRAFT_407759 [Galerina marginata CBS 339.88]